MEIQSILKPLPDSVSAWGFGSFFRGENYHDVDILIVLDCAMGDLVNLSTQLRVAALKLESELGTVVDLLILTEREFSSKPLRDIDELALLYLRGDPQVAVPPIGNNA